MSAHSKRQKRQADFKHLKYKVGKRALRRDNVTRTDFEFRTIRMPTQSALEEKNSSVNARVRGLSLDDLLPQVRHHNQKVRRDALTGLRDLILQLSPVQRQCQCTSITQATLLAISDSSRAVRRALLALLECLFPPADSAHAFQPLAHFAVVHISSALSHVHGATQDDALILLKFCLQRYAVAMAPHMTMLYSNLVLVLSKNISRLASLSSSSSSSSLSSSSAAAAAAVEAATSSSSSVSAVSTLGADKASVHSVASRSIGNRRNDSPSKMDYKSRPLLIAMECVSMLLALLPKRIDLPTLNSVQSESASRESGRALLLQTHKQQLSAILRHSSSVGSNRVSNHDNVQGLVSSELSSDAQLGSPLIQQLRTLPVKYTSSVSSGLHNPRLVAARSMKSSAGISHTTIRIKTRRGSKRKRSNRLNTFVSKSDDADSTSQARSATADASAALLVLGACDTTAVARASAPLIASIGQTVPLLLACWVEYAPSASDISSDGTVPSEWCSVDRMSPVHTQCLILVLKLLRQSLQVMGGREACKALDQTSSSLSGRTLWYGISHHILQLFPFRVLRDDSPAWVLNTDISVLINMLMYDLPESSANKFLNAHTSSLLARVHSFILVGMERHPERAVRDLLDTLGMFLPRLGYNHQVRLLDAFSDLFSNACDRSMRSICVECMRFVHIMLEPPNGAMMFKTPRYGAGWTRIAAKAACLGVCRAQGSPTTVSAVIGADLLCAALRLFIMLGRFYNEDCVPFCDIHGTLVTLFTHPAFARIPEHVQKLAVVVIHALPAALPCIVLEALQTGVCNSASVPVHIRTFAVETASHKIAHALPRAPPNRAIDTLGPSLKFLLGTLLSPRVMKLVDDANDDLQVMRACCLGIVTLPIGASNLDALLQPLIVRAAVPIAAHAISSESASVPALSPSAVRADLRRAVALSMLLYITKAASCNPKLGARIAWGALCLLQRVQHDGLQLCAGAIVYRMSLLETLRPFLSQSIDIQRVLLDLVVCSIALPETHSHRERHVVAVDALAHFFHLVPDIHQLTKECWQIWRVAVSRHDVIAPSSLAKLKALLSSELSSGAALSV